MFVLVKGMPVISIILSNGSIKTEDTRKTQSAGDVTPPYTVSRMKIVAGVPKNLRSMLMPNKNQH